MTTEGIETRAVAAVAIMQRIGEGVVGMHPMRHQVRWLKQEAKAVLEEAFTRANRLADLATNTVRDYDDAVKEAAELKKRQL